MKEIYTVKEIANKISLTAEQFAEVGIKRLSVASLNDIRRNNIEKYEIQILGILCKHLDIDADQLILFHKLKNELKDELRSE